METFQKQLLIGISSSITNNIIERFIPSYIQKIYVINARDHPLFTHVQLTFNIPVEFVDSVNSLPELDENSLLIVHQDHTYNKKFVDLLHSKNNILFVNTKFYGVDTRLRSVFDSVFVSKTHSKIDLKHLQEWYPEDKIQFLET